MTSPKVRPRRCASRPSTRPSAASSRCSRSTSRSGPASSSASSARRAAARRRCCASSPASRRRPPGRVVQNGRDVSHAPPARARLRHRLPVVRAVSQPHASPRTSPTASSTAAAARAEIAARVQELLTLVGLPDAGAKYPGQMSGGQQQRVALARALATVAVAAAARRAAVGARRQGARAAARRDPRAAAAPQVTTIMVTHDQEEALSMADRVVVMHHGAIEQVGTPQDVYERPATPFVADFMGKVNVVKAVSAGGGPLPGRRRRARRCPTAASAPASRCGSTCVPRTATSRATSPRCRTASAGASAASTTSARSASPRSPATGCGQSMVVSLSLNQLHDLDVREGGTLDFALRTERVRVFADRPARVSAAPDSAASKLLPAASSPALAVEALAARGGLALVAVRAVRVPDAAAGRRSSSAASRTAPARSSASPTSSSTCSRRRSRSRRGTR